MNRVVAERMLDRLGIASETVEDGTTALAALAATRYDVLLLDCKLPDLDGDEVARRLRAAGATSRDGRRLPIVAVTAHALPEHHAACLAAGMDAVLIKPLTTRALAELLARFGLLDDVDAAATAAS